jgi:hypothetical protein
VEVNVKFDLLLAKGKDGQTALDRSADKSNTEILETLWCWGRELQVNLKHDLSLAKGMDGLTVWDRSADNAIKRF